MEFEKEGELTTTKAGICCNVTKAVALGIVDIFRLIALSRKKEESRYCEKLNLGDRMGQSLRNRKTVFKVRSEPCSIFHGIG